MTYEQLAAMASELVGRDFKRVIMDDDQWVADQIVHGTPQPVAQFTLGFFQAAGQGRFAGVDPLLGKLIGREPAEVRDVLAE